MKIAILSIIFALSISLTAEEGLQQQKEVYIEFSMLPRAVQESVQKECQGKLTSIEKVEVNNRLFYSVVILIQGEDFTYVFDEKGRLHYQS